MAPENKSKKSDFFLIFVCKTVNLAELFSMGHLYVKNKVNIYKYISNMKIATNNIDFLHAAMLLLVIIQSCV